MRYNKIYVQYIQISLPLHCTVLAAYVMKSCGSGLTFNIICHGTLHASALPESTVNAIMDTPQNFLFSCVSFIPMLSTSSVRSPAIQQITECMYTSGTSEKTEFYLLKLLIN
jgi:hypothetical protein